MTIDPVVTQMYNALRAVANSQVLTGRPATAKQVNAAIGVAQKHFQELDAREPVMKEQVVAETFPGIYRETKGMQHLWTPEQWTTMINVLYIKALDSRRKSERIVPVGEAAGAPVKGERIVQGSIALIEAKNMHL